MKSKSGRQQHRRRRSPVQRVDAQPPKISASDRLQQLRHYSSQLTALEALRQELRQFAVRLKVEAVALSDMQRAGGADDGSMAAADNKDAATFGLSSVDCASTASGFGFSVSGGAAATAVATSCGTRASSSSCSGTYSCWDDARSQATTAAAVTASVVDTDSNSGSVTDEDEGEYDDAMAFVADLMEGELSGSCKSDGSSGDESSTSSQAYIVHQL